MHKTRIGKTNAMSSIMIMCTLNITDHTHKPPQLFQVIYAKQDIYTVIIQLMDKRILPISIFYFFRFLHMLYLYPITVSMLHSLGGNVFSASFFSFGVKQCLNK